MIERPRLWLDCETTGLHPERRPWGVAAILRPPSGTRADDQEFAWFVDILDLDLPHAELKALEVGGFWQRHPQAHHAARMPRFVDLDLPLPTTPPSSRVVRMSDLLSMLCDITPDAVVHGSNPAFDIGTLEPLFRAAGRVPGWHYHPEDVPGIVRGWLLGRGEVNPPRKSDAISLACGINPASYGRHEALGDCRWIRDLTDLIEQPVPADALVRLAQLEERLAVAERVCSLFGATAARMDTDRDKALHELWRAWVDRYGDGVERISDAEIAELARQRDDIRTRTLAKIRGGETS